MKIKNLLLILTFGAAFICTGSLHAVLISHNSLGTLLQDNFESPAAGISVAPNNGSFPGTWTVNTGSAGGYVNVHNWASPGPHEGAQYVRLLRSRVSGGERAELRGEFSQSITSGIITADFMVYTTNTDALPTFYFAQGTNFTGTDSVAIRAANDGTISARIGGTDFLDTGLTHTANTWQQWTLVLDLTAETFDLSVGGSSVTSQAFSSNKTGEIGIFVAQVAASATTGNDRIFYVDAIPEPAHYAAIFGALGLVGVLIMRRRRS